MNKNIPRFGPALLVDFSLRFLKADPTTNDR